MKSLINQEHNYTKGQFIEKYITYKQHWWSCCDTSDVILSRGLPSSCVSTLARYTLRKGVHIGDQSLCVGAGFPATVDPLQPNPAR